ncbi:lipocalin family protein [Bacteroides sp. 224]|uniref:lipocalin family protein n=1 Tax=Bacteroides sp. 224 TaxID=2302936 RepID=UPI0013D671C0|nr:lipocalin family protein [Bacteroides sp. 224]NDV66397.1 hypothetical protein [Bacteroides sp. 224]
MKKSFYFLSVLLLSSVSFIACSSDDDKNNDELIGKWQVESFSDEDEYEYSSCDYLAWFELKSDGTYTEYDSEGKTTEGSWSKKGNILTVASEDVLFPITIKIVSLTNDKLVLQFTTFEKSWVTYKKIG